MRRLVRRLSKREVEVLERSKGMDAELWRRLIKALSDAKAFDGGLPVYRRWEVAARTLTHLATLYSQVIKEEVGLETYYRISKEVWSEIGRSLTHLLRPLKIDYRDAGSVHHAVRMFSQAVMGPELEFDHVEASRDRSVIRIYGCPWYKIMVETGLQSFCEPHHEVHEAFCRSMVEALNPNLTFRFTQHTTAHSYPYCEEVVEFKRKRVIPP